MKLLLVIASCCFMQIQNETTIKKLIDQPIKHYAIEAPIIGAPPVKWFIVNNPQNSFRPKEFMHYVPTLKSVSRRLITNSGFV